MNPLKLAYDKGLRYCGRCRMVVQEIRCPDCNYLTRGRYH